MIDWRLILIGLAAGLAVSAPMGPTNIFCIRTTLRSGFKPGVYAGLGATLADTAFATAVAFGLSAVTGLISAYLRSVQLVGGAALVGYGLYALMHPPHIGPLNVRSSLRRRLGGMAAAFVLTISNPGPLVGFLAIFGGASETVMPDTALESVTLAASVMVGCLAWWLGLVALVSRLRDRLDDEWLLKINNFVGGVLIVVGAVIATRAALLH